MIPRQQDIEYVIYVIGNLTSSNFAEHLDNISYDIITDYLRSGHLTSLGLWKLIAGLIQVNPEVFMLVKDSV